MKKQLSQVLFLLVVTMLLHSISFRHMQAKKNALFSNTANKMIQLESQALNFKNQHPQSLDATSIQHTISELQFLKPSKVENIFQEDACSLFIALRTDQLNWLHITWHSKFSWISLTQSPTRSKTQRLSLESTLTSFMQDMYLTDISIPDKSNRVVRLGFSEKISQSPKYNLFVEIMGAKANIALVDARSSLILACGYQVSAGRTKGDRDAVQNQRSLQVSSKYEAPPAFVPDVKLANKFELTKALMEGSMSYYKINSLLLRSSSGISPNIVHSILRAANIVDSDDTQCLTESQAQIVMDMYLLWDASYHNPETTPSVTQDGFKLQVLPHFFQVRDRDGSQKSLYSPIQFIHKSNPNPSVSQSRVVDFLREYYTAAYRSYLFDSLRSECDRELQRKLKKADRLLSKLEAMERERTSGSSEQIRYTADLITSYLHTAERYLRPDIAEISYEDKSPIVQAAYKPQYIVHCTDFVTQEPADIIVDSGLTPGEHAQALYKRAKKIDRSAVKVQALLQQGQAYYDYLKEIEASLEAIDSYKSYNDIITLREVKEEVETMRQSDALILTDGPSNEEESKGKSLSATTGAKKAQKKDKSKGATSSSKRAKSLAVASLPSSPSSTSTSKKKLIGLLVLEPKSDSVVVTSKSVSDKVLESMLQLIASSTVKLPAMVVGRNSKQNERVTFEVAKEHHIWFHVQGSPGSHCVLLLEQNQRADDASIQFAADVASYFSQSRDSTQVAVAYCSPKHLRRPQGIRKLGLVTMSQQLGTVYGRPARGEVYAELFGPKDYKES